MIFTPTMAKERCCLTECPRQVHFLDATSLYLQLFNGHGHELLIFYGWSTLWITDFVWLKHLGYAQA
ncbi:unnamed protein product [Urochloa humidicola]